MVILSKTYADAAAARQAAEAVATAGIPERDVLLVTGSRLRDRRTELAGEFAGPIPPDAPVGTFGNRVRARGSGTGSFAGDADRLRQGTFSDADRDVVVLSDGVRTRERVTGRRGIRRMLRRYGVDAETADGVLADLEQGGSVLLVMLATLSPDEVQGRLDVPQPDVA